MQGTRSRNLVILLAILLATAPLACGKKAGPADLNVPASQGWTDSGLDIAANQVVTIKASGQVFPNSAVSGGPEGIKGHPEWKEFCVTPKAPFAGLIGKVGKGGLPFAVGLERSIHVTRAGRLFLGINDKDTVDNKGAFTAVITLK